MVLRNKKEPSELFIVFGYQFKSKFYNSETLKNNIFKMFSDTLQELKENNLDYPKVELK
jgi:hypothetical protein